jgi:hypothetical protein
MMPAVQGHQKDERRLHRDDQPSQVAPFDSWSRQDAHRGEWRLNPLLDARASANIYAEGGPPSAGSLQRWASRSTT